MVLIKKMGRAKIPITWIKSDASRHVTFTKRKKGLKKKVEELSILCGVEVCMICFGPQAGKPSSVPYSWGLPGVAHVINKYRSLSKEEQDKKKLDNTSLLEQQIKKLKIELKLKVEQNRNLENERAYFLWDDRLNSYGIDDLKQLADMVIDRTREVYDKISYVSQQQQNVLQGFGNALDQRAGPLVDGNNEIGDFDAFSSCQLNHELMMSSQGAYQQLVANLNQYSNLEDNPSSSLGAGLMSTNTQSYNNHGLNNQIPLLSLPTFIDDQKANNPPLPLNNSVTSASCGNFYLNSNTMVPMFSADAAHVLNPSALSSKGKEQDELADPGGLILSSALLKTKLHELMEPHLLSNLMWREAVGLQPDHVHFAGAYPGSMSSHEFQQQGGHEHQSEEAQWSGENMGDNEGANLLERMPFHMSAQTISVENGQYSMSGMNSGQSISVENTQFDACVVNGGQTSILQLDIGQLAAMTNEQEGLAHHVKAKEEALMWSLGEENNKMNIVYQSHMLADAEGAGSFDKGLEVAGKESNGADDEEVGCEASDARISGY